MKICIVVSHPTQFEGPFYRFATMVGGSKLHVIYTNPLKFESVYDPEISKYIHWGVELTEGYDFTVMPRHGIFLWLIQDFRKEKYDLIIVNGYSNIVYIISALIAKIYAKAVSLRVDSVNFSDNSYVKLIIKKLALTIYFSLFDIIFTTGSLSSNYLKSYGIKNNKLSIFSYAVDVEYFERHSAISESEIAAIRAKYGIPPDALVITSVAKFNKREAPWDLLKAISSCDRKNLFLFLVGDGPQREALENFAREKEIDAIFPGYVPYPDLPNIYAISDIFVHPSINEPWGVSVAEAMACGLPVVCSSRVGAAYDLISHGKNGYIYKSGDHDDLRDKLITTFYLLKTTDYKTYNKKILSKWDYKSTWNNIINVCRILNNY